MKKLPGDYIAGFVDGEGCFALKFRRDIRRERKGSPEYFYWDIEFVITLKADDKKILEHIQETLSCGRISTSKGGLVRFSVSDVSDLKTKIVPFFTKYTLRAKKSFDFLLWREAVEIFVRNQKQKVNSGRGGFQKVLWNTNDLARLEKIKKEMEIYKGGNRHSWKWLP